MELKIRHRRLHAFYTSKVLNAIMIVIVASLFLMAYMDSLLLPLICASLAFSFFIGYSLWLWLCKPKKIVVNTCLSDISSCMTIYYLFVTGLNATGQWWYIVPIVISVIVLCISFTAYKDESFEI